MYLYILIFIVLEPVHCFSIPDTGTNCGAAVSRRVRGARLKTFSFSLPHAPGLFSIHTYIYIYVLITPLALRGLQPSILEMNPGHEIRENQIHQQLNQLDKVNIEVIPMNQKTPGKLPGATFR